MKLERFENFKDEYLKSLRPSRVQEAMSYVLQGGQRLRAQLILSLIKGRGYDITRGFHCALALEMIHAYSLVHDDLPCMDDDDLRRGRPACHVAYGEDVAVLCGDALLTNSFAIVANDPYLTDTQKVKIISTYSEEAGVEGMVYGQVLDLTNEGNPHATYDDVLNIARYKTGCLFNAATKAAMYIVKDEENIAFYNRLAIDLGFAFQMQDDLFDIIKSSEEIGKPKGSDIKDDKVTALSIFSKDELKTEVENRFIAIIEMIKRHDPKMSDLIELITKIKNR